MDREFGIDSLRIVAALFIVSHHMENPSPIISAILNVGGSWALFFFFTISGFFLSYKGNLTDRSIKTISRIILISVIWSIIYVPINISDYGLNNGIKYFINYFLINYYHLWFLPALIIGFLTLNMFEQINLNKYKIPLSILIIVYYFISCKDLSYAKLLPFDLPYASIKFFLGIPFIFYGNYLAKNPPLKLTTCYKLIISGLLVCILEGFLVGFSLHYLGGLLVVAGMTNFALNRPRILNWGKVSVYGGRYGLGIFLIHPYLIYILDTINELYRLPLGGKYIDLLLTIIIALLSVLVFHLSYLFAPHLYQLLTGNQKKVLKSTAPIRNIFEEKKVNII